MRFLKNAFEHHCLLLSFSLLEFQQRQTYGIRFALMGVGDGVIPKNGFEISLKFPSTHSTSKVGRPFNIVLSQKDFGKRVGYPTQPAFL
jgi:hypothetical protein